MRQVKRMRLTRLVSILRSRYNRHMLGSAPHVIVIGAGVAGLACARGLTTHGIEPLVLEAADAVGGRVRTDLVNGYRLDRGFQVLLTGYPEVSRQLDFPSLRFQPFHPGASVRWQGAFHRLSNPLRQPLDAPATLLGPIGSLGDKLRMLRLTRDAQHKTLCQHVGGPSTSTQDVLASYGFSEAMCLRFLFPFLNGVFLDEALATPAWIFEHVWASFAQGAVVLPQEGMGAIPQQLADGLSPIRVRVNARVAEIDGTRVTLVNGERLAADTVVLATDWATAAILQGTPLPSSGRTAITVYYSAPQPPMSGPWLVLNGEEGGPVNHLCVLSEVASSYAPAGRSLIAVSLRTRTPEPDQQELAVRRYLAEWFGEAVNAWQYLRTDRVTSSLPPLNLLPSTAPTSVCELRSGLFACGDYLSTGTLDGALWSGRITADAIAERLGVPQSA